MPGCMCLSYYMSVYASMYICIFIGPNKSIIGIKRNFNFHTHKRYRLKRYSLTKGVFGHIRMKMAICPTFQPNYCFMTKNIHIINDNKQTSSSPPSPKQLCHACVCVCVQTNTCLLKLRFMHLQLQTCNPKPLNAKP